MISYLHLIYFNYFRINLMKNLNLKKIVENATRFYAIACIFARRMICKKCEPCFGDTIPVKFSFVLCSMKQLFSQLYL